MYAHLHTRTNTRAAHLRWVVIQLVDQSQGKYSRFFFSLSIGTNTGTFLSSTFMHHRLFLERRMSQISLLVFQYDKKKYTDKPQHNRLEKTFELCFRHPDTNFNQHISGHRVYQCCVSTFLTSETYCLVSCVSLTLLKELNITQTFVVKQTSALQSCGL